VLETFFSDADLHLLNPEQTATWLEKDKAPSIIDLMLANDTLHLLPYTPETCSVSFDWTCSSDHGGLMFPILVTRTAMPSAQCWSYDDWGKWWDTLLPLLPSCSVGSTKDHACRLLDVLVFTNDKTF
jgi:hypothetical protein